MDELNQYAAAIQRLCSEHKVKHLYAFGSVLTDKFTDTSDVDFIVAFDTIDLDTYADNYFDLKFSLEHLLNRKVDLLEEQAIRNPFFLQSILSQRKLIYGR